MSVVGAATVRKAERKEALPFAMIPLVFGVQQVIEGMLWLAFQYDVPQLKVITTYVFTLFSHVLWPIYVPFSIGLLESVVWRKRAIAAFLIMGIAVGLYNLYFIVQFPVISEVNCNVIYYLPHFNKVPVMALYIAATCVSCFFSSHRMVRLFGGLALLLFLAAYWFYTVAFLSVWCFFAAILSAVIYLHFTVGKKRAPA